MKRPTDDDFGTAIAWLECNEGTDGESDACKRVAEWLDKEQSARDLRVTCKRAGIPVARARALLAKGRP